MSENEEYYNMLFKIVLVGDSSVGKTNLFLRYIKNEFDPQTKATIGVEFGTKIIKINNYNIKIQIWDTAGQERYKSITNAYYKGAQGAFLVYDITNKSSFLNIDKWIRDLKNNGDEKIVLFLIGNKNDLNDDRVIDANEGKNKAKENKMFFLETSAKNNDNVNKAFDEIINNIFDVYKNLIEEEENTINKGNGIDILNTKDMNKKKKCCE